MMLFSYGHNSEIGAGFMRLYIVGGNCKKRKIMRYLIMLLIIFSLTDSIFGQKIFRADRDAYRINKYNYNFYLFDDSTCYLKGHYFDNFLYCVYKGRLEQINDTLFRFVYRPIVGFGCNKGFHTNDSVRLNIIQVDTVVLPINYRVKGADKIWKTTELKKQQLTAYIEGSNKTDFFLNTGFKDPLTKEIIIMKVSLTSDPVLTYYGSETKSSSLIISIKKNKLTIYPDQKYIFDMDTMTKDK